MESCPEGQARACKIKVSADHVLSGVLQSSADIQAFEVSGVARVTGGNLEEYENRSNP
jgi:hypothetical protein